MIGIDIIEIERMDKSKAFLEKIALPGEIEYVLRSPCESLQNQRRAALFCVKEAVMKALDMGQGSGVVFKDIELCHKDTGKPYVILHGKALEKFKNNYFDYEIEVSLSHASNVATAIAILIKK